MATEDKVYEVAVEYGVCKIVIEGVGRGRAWIEGIGPEGHVMVNRIPHIVHPTSWFRSDWDGKYRAGYYRDIKRVDTHHPEQTTNNAYDKIVAAIAEAVTKVAEAEGPNFDQIGRLAELRSARYVHQAQADNHRARAADLIKQAEQEEQAVAWLDTALATHQDLQPGEFEKTFTDCFEHGVECAQRDIAEYGGTPEGEGSLSIWDLQRTAEKKLDKVQQETPVAHISKYATVAFYQGYIKTCRDTQDAVWRKQREEEQAARAS